MSDAFPDDECCGYGHDRDVVECTTNIQRWRAEKAEADLLHFMDGTLDYQPLVRERDAALAKLAAAERALEAGRSSKAMTKLVDERDAALAKLAAAETAYDYSEARADAALARVAALEEALRECLKRTDDLAREATSFRRESNPRDHQDGKMQGLLDRIEGARVAVAHARRVLEVTK